MKGKSSHQAWSPHLAKGPQTNQSLDASPGCQEIRQNVLRRECSKLRTGKWTYSPVLSVAHMSYHLIFSILATRVLRYVVLERPSCSACTANELCSTFRPQIENLQACCTPRGHFGLGKRLLVWMLWRGWASQRPDTCQGWASGRVVLTLSAEGM